MTSPFDRMYMYRTSHQLHRPASSCCFLAESVFRFVLLLCYAHTLVDCNSLPADNRERAIDMEADRVHSYLKIACSALGFEVGEVWITSNEIVSLDVGAYLLKRSI
jgi:hypothetical protein